MDFPSCLVVKNLPAVQKTQEIRVCSLGWEIPWRRSWQPTPVFLPGKSHGPRSLVGYSLWGCRVRHNWSNFLRKLYAGQEATIRNGHGTTDCFQIEKGVCQGCILSPCLFNLYAECIMRNAGLEEAQAGPYVCIYSHCNADSGWLDLERLLDTDNLQVFGLSLSQQPGPSYQLVGFSLGVCGDFSSLYLPQSNFSPTWELPITFNLREPDSLNLLIKISQLCFQN